MFAPAVYVVFTYRSRLIWNAEPMDIKTASTTPKRKPPTERVSLTQKKKTSDVKVSKQPTSAEKLRSPKNQPSQQHSSLQKSLNQKNQ